MNFTYFKLEIFLPLEALEIVRETAAVQGAGVIGNYDHCASVSEVRGYWRPLKGASPYKGQIGDLEQSVEYKLEINCSLDVLPKLIEAIRAVHPYEEPLINVIPLLTDWKL